jgi:hypothetical protein
MWLRPVCLPALLVALGAAPARADVVRDGSVTAEVTATQVSLANSLAQRTWDRAAVRSTIVDRRGGDRTWSKDAPDFTLEIAGQKISSAAMRMTAATVSHLDRGGLRVTMTLVDDTLPTLQVTRVAEMYSGVAGFRTQTTLASTAPLLLSAATLDEAKVGAGVTPAISAFRAGSDWRDPNWTGPPFALGDPHGGTWRETRSAPAGTALRAPGEWLSLHDGAAGLFAVMERNDFPSSTAGYDGTTAALRVDFTRDVLDLGPFEEDAHAENPIADGPGRGRLVTPTGLALAPAFVGLARGDGDEAWQFHRYLVGHRLAPYAHDVVFNSDGTDANRISTGAKDDMDYATVQAVAPIARRLGVDTFVLDDGWQAASGDWQPDSPRYPEPRGKFAPRFPGATFAAVRDAIAPMRLGLWMSPMNFNPASATFKTHPEWACAPVGDALAGYNAAQPDSSSNEAGLGVWSKEAIPHVEARIRDAIDNWHVGFFKFDFLAWADCAGSGDLYDMHDAFVAMIDRLRAGHPDVTFQIDETNDYRLFPFESVSRGPTWFQNGGPPVRQLLHNLWDLSPYVPTFAIGHKLFAGDWRSDGLDTVMAAALPSHMLITTDLRTLTDAEVAAARPWIDWAKAHRADLDGVTYPLLDDPLEDDWTALQSWDPDQGRGVLLAFRQSGADASRTIALRNVPDGDYAVTSAPDDAPVAQVSAQQLRDGLEVSMPAKGARVLLIRRVTAS